MNKSNRNINTNTCRNIHSAVTITQCLGSMTSNRVISETHYIQCVAALRPGETCYLLTCCIKYAAEEPLLAWRFSISLRNMLFKMLIVFKDNSTILMESTHVPQLKKAMHTLLWLS